MHTFVPPLGAICLGMVVGWVVRYFIQRFDSFTPQALTAVIGIVAGGAAIKFVQTDPNLIWFYPIGLVIGFVVYQFMRKEAVKKSAAGPEKAQPV